LLFLYLLSQRLMEGQAQPLSLRVLADPLGMSAYMAGSRYLTAAELNAGALPITGLTLVSRLLWVSTALALLALTYRRFSFAERGVSQRRQRKLARQAALQAAPATLAQAHDARLPAPHFGRRTSLAQFRARAAMEARAIVKSPLFLILLAVAFALTLANLFTASGWMDVPIYPLAAVTVPIVDSSFRTILVIVAAYYGGELVWRERECKINLIVDATPLGAWALMMPKVLGLSIVLLATLLVGMAAGLLVQLLSGSVAPAIGDYLLWYLLPGAVDMLLVAALAVFVQALSPSKYAGWGVMFLYIVVWTFGPSLGLEFPLYIYGSVPAVPLSDMVGTGNFAPAAWWFRLFWTASALLLLTAAHLLWPRGSEQPLRSRLRRVPTRMTGGTIAGIALSATLFVSSGAWIVYNTRVLNAFHTAAQEQRYLADYEKRYFRYARLPQPAVTQVQLDVALYPSDRRAEVRGRYVLANQTNTPIHEIHVRLMNPDLMLVRLDFPGARIERDDEAFGYRIYRLDRQMQPGDVRTLSFQTRRQQAGFRASGTEAGITPDAVDLDTLALTPRIGMSDVGLIEDPALRRKYGLPEQPLFPRLNDLAATKLVPSGDAGWTTADVTVSTSANQIAVVPGQQVSHRIAAGRRTVRFVSGMPIKNLIPIQSAGYAVKTERSAGVDYVIYYDPAHRWNVDRMMTAMRASMAYYGAAFGPYQFHQVRIVETPYRQGGHAYPATLAVGEGIFEMDLSDPNQLDMVTMLTAHELAHQWWGHQVLGARMQGGSLLYETLAQYSALMVLRKLRGEADIRRYLRFQLDRYLSGRRTQVLAEEPLASVAISQQHIAYGKGALAMYLLQERMGEDAVNRALRRFVDRYRFTVAPYPRSLDLIAYLRAEANSPEDQGLITDLFERITLYDLKAVGPTAVRRADGKWDVTVPVTAKKFYANARGSETAAPLDERIQVGLFAADPRGAQFGKSDVIRLGWQNVRSGTQAIHFVTDRKPAYAGVDPYDLFIDRNTADNVAPVSG